MVDELTATEKVDEGSTVEGVQYFKAASDLIENAIWLGYGIGDVNDVMANKIQELGYSSLMERGVYEPHNEYLKTFLSSGILLFSSLLGLILVLGILSVRSKDYVLLGICWITVCSS